MLKSYNRHFEISERKVLLRIFDVVWVLFTLYIVGILFSLDYFSISSEFWTWAFVLAIYLTVFSSIFELYDLQKASQFPTVLKNVVLTTSVTVLFFLFTPYFTPVLPSNRLQIIYFYLAIIGSLLLWRYAYITLISSPRFYKRVLFIGNSANFGLIAAQLQKADPNYSIIGYIDTDSSEDCSSGSLYNLLSGENSEVLMSLENYYADAALEVQTLKRTSSEAVLDAVAPPKRKAAKKLTERWNSLTQFAGDPTSEDLIPLQRFSSDNLSEILKLHNIDEILISNTKARDSIQPIYEQLFDLLKTGFPVKDYNLVYEEKTHRIPVQYIEKDFYKFFSFSRSNQNTFYLFFLRLFDLLVSFIGLVAGGLLIPFICLGNIIGNRGSLFYFQQRIGLDGKPFTIVKFRTMCYNAEPNGAQWAQKNDSRVTRFGKFLRRSRLDEIPQFYNILKGDMSLIGPRPERPYFVKELSGMIPFYDTRHVIKPGLTGWAQVMADYGDSHGDSLDKLQYDLYYIKHRNIFLDITILTKTLSTIVFFRGQ